MEKSALFISTKNEIHGLTKLWSQVPVNLFDEVYALDGNSTDGTLEFYKEHNIPVVHHVKKGEIVNKAIETTQCEYIVFFAPDGNENPDDIEKLLQGLKDGNDMVIGSRFMKGSKNEEDEKLFAFRLWANKSFTLLVKLFWGSKLTDTINGFRSVRRSKAVEMQLESTGFDIEFQMSIRGLKLGHKIVEIPTIEASRIFGSTSAYSLPTGILMGKRLLKELFCKTVTKKK